MTPSFTAVVTCHDGDPNPIVTNLLTQTRRPDEILIFVSNPTPEAREMILQLEDEPRMWFYIVPNRDDWGHDKRALGLDYATGDFIGWFNHDDAYEPNYIESLLGAAQDADADIAFCDWTQGAYQNAGRAEFTMGSSTSGNWIGRTSIVRAAGYHSRQYSADGVLINRIREQRARVVKVEGIPLYHHNPR